MARERIVAGLDVGTSKVALTVGLLHDGLVHIIGIGSAPCSGVRRGNVVDIEETVSAISAALEEAERMAGVAISSAWIGIAGTQIARATSKGVIAVARSDGEITTSDVERVVEAARAVALPPNRDILHVFPKTFLIDGQEGVRDPLGMTGIRLEVDTHVIGVQSGILRNLSKCVYRAGLEIDGVVFSPLATARALLTKKQRDIGCVLIDLGAGTVNLAAFEEDELLTANVLPIGANHITNDIAIGLRVSIETAESIKTELGTALPEKVREVESIDLEKFDAQNERERPKRKYVAEIIEARLNELFTMIRDELKSISKDGMLPAGAILTGGGAKLNDIAEFAKNTLRLPVAIGSPSMDISGVVDKLDDPVYATSVGLLLWGLDSHPNRPRTSRLTPNIGGVVERARGLLKQLLP